MSELINNNGSWATFRWRFFSSVSALALTAYISSSGVVRAEDTERPILWIELGGQLSELQDGQEAFAPPLMDGRPSIFEPSQKFEKSPKSSIDETGKISFEPTGSDWVFSASIRFGRSGSNKDIRQQTNPKANVLKFHTQTSRPGYGNVYNHTESQFPNAARFADTSAQTGEHHLIADFQAGKDVGLGMFGGKDGSSVLNLGVRFAQFSAKSNIVLKSNPDWHFVYKTINYPSFGINNEKFAKYQPYHSNAASLEAVRSFHGIGPSISWNASAPVAGGVDRGEVSLDWGLNAALLFGRQKAFLHHQTTAQYHPKARYQNTGFRLLLSQHSTDHARSRSATVPNVGGFAGLAFRVENFKVSAGYRADLFFGPMDGGIDTAKKENVGFYGPFASVSIGLGG